MWLQQLVVLAVFIAVGGRPSTEGLRDFELLDYPPVEVAFNTDDVEGSGKEDVGCSQLEKRPIEINFKAYKREFPLRLSAVCGETIIRQTIAAEAVLAVDEGSGVIVAAQQTVAAIEHHQFYQGYVLGNANSTVEGTIHGGVFQGYIIVQYSGRQHKFFVERLPKPENGEEQEASKQKKPAAHSLIFESHVEGNVIGAVQTQEFVAISGSGEEVLGTCTSRLHNHQHVEGSGSET